MDSDFDPRLYGARWAGLYDEWHAGMMDDDGAVAALAELGGPVLELGVGTGRLAVPLAARGVEVVGVDISTDMLAQLRAKPGSDAVTIVEADMTTVTLGREFAVVLIAFSSIFALPSQRDQVRVFRNAARHLKPGGRFVLEAAAVGNTERRREPLNLARLEHDRLVLSAGRLDPVSGFYHGAWVVLEPSGLKFYPVQGRNLPHAEMDLMAELAGLELENRWGDWKGGDFTADSTLHVSMYRKPTGEA